METELNVGNYYGMLAIKEEDGKFFWCVENYDGCFWKEIPKDLYDCLFEHKDV